jgi:transcriptional antiterminator RfaH
MNNFREGWYLIYTRPKHEKKVHERLVELKIDCFLPLKKQLRVSQERKRIVDEPLFPSYIFIYLTNMQNYYKGMDTDGALYYVRTGKEIARVSETVVNNIRLLVNQMKDFEVSERRFQPAQRVVISKGALTGLTCEVVHFENKQKLLVRVDLLRRNLLLTLPEGYLTAISN